MAGPFLLLFGADSGSNLSGALNTGIVYVEFGFGSTWTDAVSSVNWVDESSRVMVAEGRGVTVDRGRSTEFERMRAGTMTLTLLNSDRRFDPEYSSSPHNGNLVPGVPVRVTVKVNAVDYPVFLGYVDDWPQSYHPSNNMGTVELSCTDLFGVLARTRLPQSVLEYEYRQLSPTAYFPLDESSGANVMFDAVGGQDGRHQETEPGKDPIVVGLASATFIAHEKTARAFTDKWFLVEDYPFSIAAWVRADEDHTIDRVVWQTARDLSGAFTVSLFQGGSAENFGVNVTDAGVSVSNNNTLVPFDDGDPHLIVSAFTSSSTWRVYLDGVQVAGDPSVAYDWQPFRWWSFGNEADNKGGDFGLDGDMAAVAFFPSALDATKSLALYNAGLTPWDGDKSGERIGNVLDTIGHPSADRDLDTGHTILGPAVLARQYALDYLLKVADSEQGRLFIARDGKVTLRERYDAMVSTSSATFTDDGGADSPYATVQLNQPRQFIHNKVTVTADGQNPVAVEDTASIGAHGESEITVDAPLLANANTQRSLCEYIVDRHKDPHTRVFGLRVPLHADFLTLAPVVLALELGDRVTFERTPQGVGSQIVTEQIIEGINHRFTATEWWVELHLSPADTREYAVFGTSEFGDTEARFGF